MLAEKLMHQAVKADDDKEKKDIEDRAKEYANLGGFKIDQPIWDWTEMMATKSMVRRRTRTTVRQNKDTQLQEWAATMERVWEEKIDECSTIDQARDLEDLAFKELGAGTRLSNEWKEYRHDKEGGDSEYDSQGSENADAKDNNDVVHEISEGHSDTEEGESTLEGMKEIKATVAVETQAEVNARIA